MANEATLQEGLNIGAELLNAAKWLPEIQISYGGKKAILLGGAASEVGAIFLRCLCPECVDRQPNVLSDDTCLWSLVDFYGPHTSGLELGEDLEIYTAVVRGNFTATVVSTGLQVPLGKLMQLVAENSGGASWVGRVIHVYWWAEQREGTQDAFGTWYPCEVKEYRPESGEYLVEYDFPDNKERQVLSPAVCFTHVGTTPPAPGTVPTPMGSFTGLGPQQRPAVPATVPGKPAPAKGPGPGPGMGERPASTGSRFASAVAAPNAVAGQAGGAVVSEGSGASQLAGVVAGNRTPGNEAAAGGKAGLAGPKTTEIVLPKLEDSGQAVDIARGFLAVSAALNVTAVERADVMKSLRYMPDQEREFMFVYLVDACRRNSMTEVRCILEDVRNFT